MAIRPDETFHATAQLAMQAPVEKYGFTVMLSPDGAQSDGIAVVDLDESSSTYGQIVHQVIVPNKGDEFHHFGWNACSSSLSPLTGHAFLERRYLIVPGNRSSRIYIIDVKEPLKAKIHKTIEPEELFAKTGYSRPHTIHCGPEGIYVSTLGGGGEDGTDGPPGIFIMDCETFEIIGRYEMDRGPQDKHYLAGPSVCVKDLVQSGYCLGYKSGYSWCHRYLHQHVNKCYRYSNQAEHLP